MLRRTVFVTWRTPSRQVDIRFCSQNLNDPLSVAAAAGFVCIKSYSKPNEMKFNHQVFLGNLLTRSTNFTVFNVLHPCRDLHIWNFFFSFLRILFSRFLPRIRRLVQNCSSTFQKKSGSKPSKFNHLSFWMANNYSSASQPRTTRRGNVHYEGRLYLPQ